MLKVTVATAKKMAEICSKPDASERTKFILIQHTARSMVRQRRDIRDEQKVFRREAATLEACMPHATIQIAGLRGLAKTHRQAELEGVERCLVGLGNMLLHDREGSFEKLGFDTVCDLLSINPVHRVGVELCGGARGLAELIYVSRLENSSGPHSDGWGEGGPLFEACFAATCHWLRTAPEEDLPDLFGPDSPFDGVKLVEAKVETLQ